MPSQVALRTISKTTSHRHQLIGIQPELQADIPQRIFRRHTAVVFNIAEVGRRFFEAPRKLPKRQLSGDPRVPDHIP